MHLEFVVLGTPISNQQSTPNGRKNLTVWRKKVMAEAKAVWGKKTRLSSPQKLKAILINFHGKGGPTVDLDNMSKPILDAMQSVVYDNDRQFCQAEFTHVPIDARFRFVGTSIIIANSINAGKPFVYVRIEDPVDPFPLPGVNS